MNVLGIIAEYNPFHNGHLYHLEKSKERTGAEFAVAVMSGNFMQRGELAILDKWTRSKMAVKCGIDLVLELPFVYACNSAEYFARGGIEILNGLGLVSHLSFGSETGNLDELAALGRFLARETEEFTLVIKKNLEKGMPYAKAREEGIKEILGEGAASLVTQPNNILAIEYLKQIERTKSSITPITVQRKGAGYLAEKPEGGFASATAIRQHLTPEDRADFVPEIVAKQLPERREDDLLFPFVQGHILTTDATKLGNIFSMKEGLENKLKKEVREANTLDDLIDRVRSRRYPTSTIRRLLNHMLINLENFDHSHYGRILAFNEKGAQLLNLIKKEACARIPIVTNINKTNPLPENIKYDISASDLYNLIRGHDLYHNSDYVQSPKMTV